VFEQDIARQRPEERNAGADQHRNAGDDQAMDESGTEEPLDGQPAVDVEVLEAARLESRHDLLRRARHPLDGRAGRRRSQPAPAEHDHRLGSVRPGLEGPDHFVRLPSHDQCVHRGHELLEAVGLVAAHVEKVERVIRPGDEPVNTGADEDGGVHAGQHSAGPVQPAASTGV